MAGTLEYVPLTTLAHWPRNPKEHDLGAIHESIERFGFQGALILNGDRVVSGNGRLTALMQRRTLGNKAPKGIRVEGDSWLVPVIRGEFGSEREAEAFVIAANQTTILGGWDATELADMLGDFAVNDDLSGIGFDGDDVDRLVKQVAEDLRLDYDFLGDEGQEDARAEEQRGFPLAIVLARAEYDEWQAYKAETKARDDKTAFMAMWRADGS